MKLSPYTPLNKGRNRQLKGVFAPDKPRRPIFRLLIKMLADNILWLRLANAYISSVINGIKNKTG